MSDSPPGGERAGREMLRHTLATLAYRGGNHAKADIAAGRVGPDQTASRVEFD